MKTLVAEDDHLSRLLLSQIISGFGTCHVAVNGVEAVKYFRKALEEGDPYDLVCMDIMMPVMDGQQALKKIRDLEKKYGVERRDAARAIMVTALDDANNVAMAFGQGECEAFHTKPVDKKKLLGQLCELGLLGRQDLRAEVSS